MQKGMDMTNGPLLKKIIFFTIPVMLTGVLQLFFNAMDMVVIGRYAGETSLAAVGCTSSVVNLLVNMFMGFSVGAGIVMAQSVGAENKRDIDNTLNTSMILGLISGILVGVIGFFGAPLIMSLMDTPKDVLPKSVLYLRILFLGMPANMVLNFGASLLRSIGDAKRPLYYLTLAGVINVLLNLFFVLVFKMDVDGVALATIISQIVAALLTIRCLIKGNEYFKLSLKNTNINKKILLKTIKIGLPAGIQSSLFSISNILIQSSVNAYGTVVVAGNAAAASVEGFVYTSMNSFYQSALSFTGQNMGARKYERITKTMFICFGLVMAVGFLMGNGVYILGDKLIGFYVPENPEAVAYGIKRISIIGRFYFLCGMMEITTGVLRGMGYSLSTMIVSIFGVCGFRVLWIYTVYRWIHSLNCLYSSYIVSWILVFSINIVIYFIIRRKYNNSTSGAL